MMYISHQFQDIRYANYHARTENSVEKKEEKKEKKEVEEINTRPLYNCFLDQSKVFNFSTPGREIVYDRCIINGHRSAVCVIYIHLPLDFPFVAPPYFRIEPLIVEIAHRSTVRFVLIRALIAVVISRKCCHDSAMYPPFERHTRSPITKIENVFLSYRFDPIKRVSKKQLLLLLKFPFVKLFSV